MLLWSLKEVLELGRTDTPYGQDRLRQNNDWDCRDCGKRAKVKVEDYDGLHRTYAGCFCLTCAKKRIYSDGGRLCVCGEEPKLQAYNGIAINRYNEWWHLFCYMDRGNRFQTHQVRGNFARDELDEIADNKRLNHAITGRYEW